MGGLWGAGGPTGRRVGGQLILGKRLVSRFNFLAKYSTYVLQLSHMVSSGSLLSCDAMFFTVGSQFSGKKCFFLR